MPIGPQGQKRPHGAVATAWKVARILTGEDPEEYEPAKSSATSATGKSPDTTLGEEKTGARVPPAQAPGSVPLP